MLLSNNAMEFQFNQQYLPMDSIDKLRKICPNNKILEEMLLKSGGDVNKAINIRERYNETSELENLYDMVEFDSDVENKIYVYKPHISNPEQEKEYNDIITYLNKRSIKFFEGYHGSEDVALIEQYLKNGQTVLFMTCSFIIVGFDNVITQTKFILRYLETGIEPSDDDINSLSSNYENYDDELTDERRLTKLINGTVELIKALNPLTYIIQKDYVPDSVVGERINVIRTNKWYVQQRRILIFSDRSIIRMNPETKERKSVRMYKEIINVISNENNLRLQYVDNQFDYLEATRADIQKILFVIKKNLPDVEIVEN